MVDILLLATTCISTAAAAYYAVRYRQVRQETANWRMVRPGYHAYIQRLLNQNRQQQAELAELRAHRAKRLAAVRKYAENRKQKGKQA